jgi:uncharacterized membrane protein YfcA
VTRITRSRVAPVDVLRQMPHTPASLAMATLLALLGVFVIGLSKAGFATGLGMLSTPLMAQALPARTAIGVILPLLCLADAFTMAAYWRRWRTSLVAWPLVGTLVGIALATAFVRSISELALRRSIGVVGLVLTLLLILRNHSRPHAVYRPAPWHGVLVGLAAGVSSTIAHAAGPIVALYLLAQRLDKTTFVATSGLFFTVNNLMKVPPYLATGLIDRVSLWLSLRYALAVPAGIAAGWWANRHVPQKHFDTLVALLMLATSLELLLS